MASLTVSLTSRWPISTFSHQMHHLFLASSLISWPKFDSAGEQFHLPLCRSNHPPYVFLCWMLIYSLLLTPWACFPGYPITTQQWGCLNSLCYPPFQYSFLWHYKSQPGSNKKKLHTEFGFLLDFTSMARLYYYKTQGSIKCLQTVSKRAPYSITITVLQQIYSKLQPFHTHAVDSSLLWVTCTLAFFGFLWSSKFAYNGKFNLHSHISKTDISFKPNIFSPKFLEITIKKSRTDPFRETAKLTIARSNSNICAIIAPLHICGLVQPHQQEQLDFLIG